MYNEGRIDDYGPIKQWHRLIFVEYQRCEGLRNVQTQRREARWSRILT